MSRYEDLKKKSNGTTQGQKDEEQVEQSRYQSIKQSRGNRSYGVDNDYINAFIQDANNFFTTSQSDYNNLTWQSGTDKEKSKSRSDTMADLRSRSANIRAFANANKSRMDESAYNELVSVLNRIDSGRENVFQSFYKAEQTYSKYKTQEAYDLAVEKAKADQENWSELTGGYDPSKHKAQGQAGWAAYTEQQEQWANKPKEESKPKEKTFWDYLAMMGEGRDTTLPLHVDTNAIAKSHQENEAIMRNPKPNWTDEQREIYGYLWNTQRQKAGDFAFAINNMLNVQAEDAKIKGVQGSATDNFLSGAGHTVGAIASAPFGLADYIDDLIAAGTYENMPTADGDLSLFEYSQAVTSGISQHLNETGGTLNEDIPIIGGKGWGDV